jgi:hypothetical protein
MASFSRSFRLLKQLKRLPISTGSERCFRGDEQHWERLAHLTTTQKVAGNNLRKCARTSPRAAPQSGRNGPVQVGPFVFGNELICDISVPIPTQRHDLVNALGSLLNDTRHRELVECPTHPVGLNACNLSDQVDGGIHVEDNEHIKQLSGLWTQAIYACSFLFPKPVWKGQGIPSHCIHSTGRPETSIGGRDKPARLNQRIDLLGNGAWNPAQFFRQTSPKSSPKCTHYSKISDQCDHCGAGQSL